MVRPRRGANAAGPRRSLFLTTAIVTLISAMAGPRSASAQSVVITGNNNLGSLAAPGWSTVDDVSVGYTGPGTMDITAGGAVNNANGYIGDGATGQGTVTVSGSDGSGNASTWTNNGNLVVGQDGSATLNIQNGGVVNNAYGYVGAGATGVGNVTVTGQGSTWNNSGQTIIGDLGTGALSILNGGVVNTGTTATLGNQSDPSGTGAGTVTVSGHDASGNASTWNIANQILVGGADDVNSRGTLNILNGGVVNSGQGVIAWGIGSQGDVTVSGRDTNGHASTWKAENNIYVGFNGNGTLKVLDGAAVTTSAAGGGAAAVYIGYFAGSTGAVTVASSTGNVSSLTASDRIDVGSQGSGTLTVEKGGFVNALSEVYVGHYSGSSGALYLNGDATGRGVVETGAVIKGAGVTTILDLNGGILRANRDEANFLNGFTALTVGAGGAWFDTNTYDIAIGTDFSGTSSFNKLGLGMLTLTGDSSGFTGASTVSAGTLAVNGILGGSMLVDTAGRLTGTGQVGVTTNGGVIAPGYGGAMGTLTIQGSYVGNGGRLEIATVLGDDNSATSRLAINGATSGSTQVTVINRGGLGAQTIEGIKIVDVTGASNGSFILDGNYIFHGAPAVIAGAYAYRLYQGGVSTPTDGDWYLRSALTDPGTPGGAGGTTPLYQPGVPVYEAYGANLQALNALSTLQQRVGTRTWMPGSPTDGNGIWGRTESTRGRFNAAVSSTGLDQSIDTWKMQVGADRVLLDTATAGRLVAGINVSYGEANSRISSAFGDGALKTNGYGFGATLTWYGLQGFYVDGQVQVSRYNSDLYSTLLNALGHDNAGRGEAFSIEAGKRIALGDKSGITPQFQVVYSNVRFDRFVDPSGAVVTADRNDGLKTRWGVAFDHQRMWDGGRSNVYAIANVSYESRDGMRTRVSDTLVTQANERLWGELGLGVSVNWRKDLAVYGEVSGNTPFHGFGNSYILKGNVGLRAQF